MSYKVEWRKLADEKPPDNLFWDMQWIYTTDGRVTFARWVGHRPIVLLDGQSITDGYLRGGLWFEGVTHWAYIQAHPPLPPEVE